jgi:multicomponent Na+:H+ antiporter subunit C
MSDIGTAYGLWHYWIVIFLMMTGLYIVMARDNLVKKVMGLNIFQSSVIMFYVAMGKVDGGTAPIWPKGADGLYENVTFSNPIPHVLMLTAIVVGIATTALALALVVRINEDYGTAEEDEISQLDVEAS